MRTLLDRAGLRTLWTEINGVRWYLAGSCHKCGGCCAQNRPKCANLKKEVWDGVPVGICTDFWNRPWYCAYYPFDPRDPLPESCGFSWREVETEDDI